ncbi:MAG: hypothetical protein SPL22_13350 [Treponema sp.]|uniref:hypothetical protein n=1 Tax=Treponema sp. TaxID=166 RepID=UPI002A917EF0|nr:hypothetical protein [Treponema sp.]MDY6398698.1 hypothetical protein [Treponema sp.]
MNYKIILSNKNLLIKLSIIFASIIVFSIALHFFSHIGTNRRVFIYPLAGSSKTQKEVRYLASKPVQGKVCLYVDELVLGPSFYRGRPLFTLGTRVEYCFQRDKTLYVGLSKEAALQGNGAVPFTKGAAMLKKNIKKNFTGIKSIELFIDGNFIAD